MTEAAPSIRAVVFDLGGVIVDVDMARVAAPFAEATGASVEDVRRVIECDDAWREYECGRISTEQYRRHLASLLGGPMTLGQFECGWNSIYVGVSEGVAGLLAGLTGRLRIAALTNTNACHAAVWLKRYADVLRPFERIFMSFEMGCRKPEPECFQLVLDWLGLPPGAVAFVDDSGENVTAAESLGMKGILAAGTESIAAGLRGLGMDV